MRIEPCACLARRPVSKVSGRPLIMTDSRTKDMWSSLLLSAAQPSSSVHEREGLMRMNRRARVAAVLRKRRNEKGTAAIRDPLRESELLAEVQSSDRLAVAIEARLLEVVEEP